MPDIASLQPLEVEPESDRLRKVAAWKAENRTGFEGTMTAALMQGPTAHLFQALGNAPAFWPVDPYFQWNDKLFNELSDGVDPSYWPQLADANSYQHAAYIANIAKQRSRYSDQLASRGVGGTAASIVAGLVDPAYLAATMASGGLAGFGEVSNVGRLAQIGLLNAAAFGGLEKFKQIQEPKITGTDVALAATAGGLMAVVGGAASGLPRTARFPLGGLAAAAPGTAYAAFTSEEQDRSRDVMLNFLPQFFIGGAMASIHPAVREMNIAVDKAARNSIKDQQFDVVKQHAESIGKKPEEILSPEGRDYFRPMFTEHELSQGALGGFQPEIDKLLGVDRGAKSVSKPVAPKSTSPLADLLRTSQNDLNELLEHRAIKTGIVPNKVAETKAPEPSLNFSDIQRIIAQVEAENPVINDSPTPTKTVKMSTVDTRTTETSPNAVVQKPTQPREMTFREFQEAFVRGDIASPTETTKQSSTSDGKTTISESSRSLSARELYDRLKASGEVPTVPPPATTGAVGAASESDPVFAVWAKKAAKVDQKIGDLDLSGVTDDPASWNRFSMAGMASRGEAPEITRAANMLGRDDVPKEGGMAFFSAIEARRDWHGANAQQILTLNKDAYGKYITAEREAGRHPMKYWEFLDAGGKAYRKPTPNADPQINRVVENLRGIRKADLERDQRHGVRGAVETKWDPNRLDRHWIRSKLDDALNKHGLKRLLEWAHKDIMAHPENADLTEKQSLALARDILMGAGRQRTMIDAEEANHFQIELYDTLASRLSQMDPSLTPEDIHAIIYQKSEVSESEGTGAGNPQRFRRQIRMDVDSVHTGVDPATGLESPFSFSDVIDNNIERVGLSNSSQLAGLAAMAEVYRQFSTPDRPIENLTQLKQLLASKALARGLDKSAFETDLERIDTMAQHVLGRPINENTLWNRSLRTLRNFSFARVINPSTAIRNFFEIGAALAEPGLKAIVHSVPSLGEVFVGARNGVMRSQLGRELTHMGIMLGEFNHRTMPGPEQGDLYFPPENTAQRKAEAVFRATEHGARTVANAVSTYSGMGPTQTILQRGIGRFIAQKWFDIAQSGKLPSVKRLGAMGLDEAMAKRIIAEINGENHAIYQRSVFGKTLTGFNWEKWEDVEAASALRAAISKTSQRLVYKPDPTQMAMWMENESAKSIMQFRHYATGAYESKTLFNLSMNDHISYLSFTAQLASKSIAYVLGTYLYAQARPDRDKYLRDRLTSSMIAKAAFAQAEFSSLIPIGVDAGAAIMGRSPLFAFSRTTNLGNQPGLSGLVTSSASLDTLDKVGRLIGLPPEKLLDFAEYAIDQSHRMPPVFDQRDARTVAGGLPFQNFPGIKQGIEAVIRRTPRHPK